MASFDPTTLLRRSAAYTAGLAAAVAVVTAMAWGWDLGLGVALGALVGWANVWMISRAVSAVLKDPERHRPTGGRKWALPLVLLLKWPLVLLALAGILWYLPARPEGVAIGVFLSLVGAAFAASVDRAGRSHPQGDDSSDSSD